MDPVAAGSSSSSWRDNSCLDTTEKICTWLPIPCLGLTALGGVGFGFSALFATSSTPAVIATQSSAIASAAFDFGVTLVSLFSCGCYYKNMPQMSFEENVRRQGEENAKLGNLEKEIDKSVDALTLRNQELRQALKEAEEKAIALRQELDEKVADLLKSGDNLNQTVAQFDALQKDFVKAKKSLEEGKQLVIFLMKLSSSMKEDIKASKAAAETLKARNYDFKKVLGSFDAENSELKSLLNTYGKMIEQEHAGFLLLADAYTKLDHLYLGLKKEVEELSRHSQEISIDMAEDKQNIEKLQNLANRLATLTNQIH